MGSGEQLNQTEFTQPALLTASIALWRLWTQAGGTADFLAGHSLGEYSALVASHVLSLKDGVRIVQKRGQLMQAAVPLGAGGMAAVMGLQDDEILAGFVRLSFVRLSSVRRSFVRLSFVRLSFARLSFVRLSFVRLSL